MQCNLFILKKKFYLMRYSLVLNPTLFQTNFLLNIFRETSIYITGFHYEYSDMWFALENRNTKQVLWFRLPHKKCDGTQ